MSSILLYGSFVQQPQKSDFKEGLQQKANLNSAAAELVSRCSTSILYSIRKLPLN